MSSPKSGPLKRIIFGTTPFTTKLNFKYRNSFHNAYISIANKNLFVQPAHIVKYCACKLSNQINPSEIVLEKGIFNQPLINCNKPLVQISISHFDIIYGCLAFFEHFPMAIDIEGIDNVKAQSVKSQLTEFEIKNFELNSINLTALWTAKEAVSKVCRSGLFSDFKIFGVSKMARENNIIYCNFENFSHLQSVSYVLEHLVVTIVFAKDAKFINLKNNFYND